MPVGVNAFSLDNSKRYHMKFITLTLLHNQVSFNKQLEINYFNFIQAYAFTCAI